MSLTELLKKWQNMKKFTNIQLLILAAVLIISFLLRYHNHIYFPKRGETSDEYAFAFQGVSLLTRGYPIAWSAIPIYPEKNRSNLTIDGIYFPIVHPYLDHPPLFGILSGSFAILKNQIFFDDIQLSTIRKLPLLLSMISTLLLFLIANKLYGFKMGILTVLIFSTVTVYVLNMRLNVAETLITPLLLLSLFILIKVKKTITWKKIILLGVIATMGIFTKILGVIIFLTILYFLIFEYKLKREKIALFIGIFLLGVLLLFIYGLSYGGEFFWQIQLYQGARNLGGQTISTLLSTPIIVNSIFYDSWYYLGIISLIIVASSFKENKYIVIPAVFYILLMALSVSKTDLHSWYTIPLFPFMALSSAIILDKIRSKLSWSSLFVILVLGMFYSTYILEKHTELTTLAYRILLLIFLIPILLILSCNKKESYKKILNYYFYIFILGNIYIILSYT